MIIYSGTAGYLDDIPVNQVTRFEKGFVDYLRSDCKDLLDDLTKNDRKVDGELEDLIKKAIEAFKGIFS